MKPHYIRFRPGRRSGVSSSIITATVTPATSVLASGQALDETTNWSTFLLTSNYATNASGETISTVTVNYIGDTPDASTNLWGGEANHFSITVADSAGNEETFTTILRTVAQTDFVMTFDGTTFDMPLFGGGTTDAVVKVDDSAERIVATFDDANLSYTGLTAGTHTLRLRGNIVGIDFNANPTAAAQVLTVENLGDLQYDTMVNSFRGCVNMTSFTAGTSNVSSVSVFRGTWTNCSSMVTCDLTGMDFSSCNTLESTWGGCALLENIDFTIVTDGAAPLRADECFFNAPNIVGLDPSGLNITKMIQIGTYSGGLFNFLDNLNLSTEVYDQTLINFAAQLPIDIPFSISGGEGFICDFQLSQPTMGGAVETARAALINAGFYIEDAETTNPDTMAAPTLVADSPTQFTITRSARPFTGGLPIRYYDYRYSTDEVNWVEVLGTIDDLWTTKAVTGVTEDTLYYVQVRARTPSLSGAWSASETVTTPSATVISVNDDGGSPVLVIPDSTPDAQTVSFSIGGTTYTTDYLGTTTLTAGLLRAGPVCFERVTITGTATENETLTVVPGQWVYPDADPGDQTFALINETDGARTLVGLEYVLVADDVGDTVRVDETFGGVTVPSLSTSTVLSAGTVPDAFLVGDWSIATGPTTTPNSLTVTISSLPADNGSTITDVEYRVDTAGSWFSLDTAAPGSSTDIELALPQTGYDIELRAKSAVGESSASDIKTQTSGAGVPDPVAFGAWSAETGSGEKGIDFTISTAPANNGSAIIDYEYELDASNSWFSLGISSPGTVSITAPAENTLYDARVRAVNAVGNSIASDIEFVTSNDLLYTYLMENGVDTLLLENNDRILLEA